MQIKNTFSLIIIITTSLGLFAQKGKIRGTIIEDATGQPLIGCSVIIEGTTNGSITDFDGNFSITAEPGTYNLVSSYVSFATQKISGVVVKTDGVTVINVR
ncbi:MAG TPA: carboxypeptidase-like regulatory domain-containing protein, partial [Vicingus sp.]|nr:carboxypeptidase-like regulatory domain-containing protein [Vicingus sp.]